MAQPQAYNREVDFTERDGDDTNHAGINAELDAAALSINQIRDNLALIQKDDGSLQNGIVGAEQLAQSAFDAIKTDINEAVQDAQQAAESATLAANTAIAARDDAQTAETNAETAATAALLNANTATTKAAEAAASATSAAGSASTATTKASEASTSATNAAASATAAAGSATTASTQATNAANSATASATSATNSANSATTATTQAGIATTQASNAAASATAASASLDEFDDRYLGSKTADPTTDNDGNALISGALYFNSVAGEMRVWAGTFWKAAGSSVNGTINTAKYTATAGQTTFAIVYDVGFVHVYLNGVKLESGVDFTANNGTSVVLATGATAGDVVDMIAFGIFSVANTYTKAELNAPNGSSLVGFQQSGTGAVQRTAQDKMQETVSVKDFGAVGDGVTDDTAAIQTALNTGRSIYFPKPSNVYLVTASLSVKEGQVLHGETKGGEGVYPGLYANMPSPIFQLGDGSNIHLRLMSFNNLCARNIGGPVIVSRYATNWSAFNCGFYSSGDGYNTVDMRQSYRIAFYNCDIGKSGTGWAAFLMDNSNVILFSNCAISGGTSGGVADIGRSYNVTFQNCVFEVTLYGIRLGTNANATYGGECNSIVIQGCSWEQCSEPLRIGDQYACRGVTLNGNFFSNNNTSYIPDRTALIRIGRVSGLVVNGNRFTPYSTEFVFDFYLSSSSALDTVHEGSIEDNEFSSIGAGITYSGDYATVGNRSRIPRGLYLEYGVSDLTNDAIRVGQQYDFTTGMVSPSALSNTTFICTTGGTGGYIGKVELVKVDQSNNMTGTLAIGSTTSYNENLNLDVTTVSWTNTGYTYYADITSLVYKFLRVNNFFLIRLVSGTGTGTVQLKITYHK